MKLSVIGCGDAFGSGGRLNTCFYVNAGVVNYLVDCGATSLPGLKAQGIRVDDIDAVIISHFHGDHYGGLPFLLLEAAVYGRKKKIQVISPEGGRERISALLDLLYPGTEVLTKLTIEFLEYHTGEVLKAGPINLQAFGVIHAEKALPHALRIEVEGKVLAYSGDTSWTDVLIPLSAAADIFICECNFFEFQVKGHLNYRELEKHLPDFSCKSMYLTHFDQEMIAHLDELNIKYLNDGMELIF